MKAIKINNKGSHDIYFKIKINGMGRQLTLQGNKKECIAKANAWLQWEVSRDILSMASGKKPMTT